MYRSNKKIYKYFDFKLFDNPKNKDIHSFEEEDIVMLENFHIKIIIMKIILYICCASDVDLRQVITDARQVSIDI